MTRAVLGVVMLAALLAPAAATAIPFAPASTYSYRILDAPTSSDERAIKTLGLQPTAQRKSNALFDALASVLGGTAPALNFVPTGSPLAPGDMAANLTDRPGAPKGTINVDPLAVEALINNASIYHSSGVNGYPHEMAHLRQTPAILASTPDAEGGAQAFADLVTPEAARRARIPYASGNYDGAYSSFVKAARARGNDWLTGTQFGHAPVPWP